MVEPENVGIGFSEASNGLPHEKDGCEPQSKPQPKTGVGQKPTCPLCGSKSVWRDGLRYTAQGPIQRFLCRTCGCRFSESKVKFNVSAKPLEGSNHILNSGEIQTVGFLSGKESFDDGALPFSEYIGSHGGPPFILTARKILNTSYPNSKDCRACGEKVSPKSSAGKAAALTEEKTLTQKWDAGATEKTSINVDAEGKLLEYAWHLKKNGFSEATIETRVKKLKRLMKLGANLFNPESVKDAMAKAEWSVNTKSNVAAIYGSFAKFYGLKWEPPIYKPLQRIPFIPTEAEIDTLIAGAGRKMAALLQLLKETGVRIGEACRLKWIDIDFERRTIRITAEKNSNPRIFRVSSKLIDMLNAVPRRGETVFNVNPRILASNFRALRLRLAQRFGNPRLKQITFHTIRHWKATTEYHKTKDILHVKELLGHKCLDSTLVYVNIERAVYGADGNDEFTVKTAKTPEEIKALLEVGFEYVCEKDGLMFFRKRR